MIDETGTELFESVIKSVTPSPVGWTIEMIDGWTLMAWNGPECTQTPEPEEVIQYRAIGLDVRGITIGGRVYSYDHSFTPARTTLGSSG